MFVERLKKEQIIEIIDRLGLFGENADKAYLKYGKLGKLVRVCSSVNSEKWVIIKQFSKNGTIYTERNTTDRDKAFDNCYLVSDFAIEPAQENITKKDYENVQRVYRKAMYEIFGEEYLQAKDEYNRVNLMRRGFSEAPKRSMYSNTYLDIEGTLIDKKWKNQIAKVIKAHEKLNEQQKELTK